MNIQSLRKGLAHLSFLCVVAFGFVNLTATIAAAQRNDSTKVSAETKASFRIEPLVQRFKARRGEVVPFSFDVTATGKDMEIQIAPTSMRQEESGLVLPREGAVAEEGLHLLSPSTFNLKSGESRKIQGEVRVPIAKSNYLSFGILVKDSGQLQIDPNESLQPGESRAAIRFVTQYLLRVDVETGLEDFTELKRMTLEQGAITAINGEPIAQVYLVNPTNFAFQCTVQGTIQSSQSRRPKPFYMGLASRRELSVEKRSVVRILPKSRLRLEANVESLLFPGLQQLEIKLRSDNRTALEKSFDLDVRKGDFPGLETKIAFVGNQLSVEPAQIELATIGRSARTSTLLFHNNSNKTQMVSLATSTLDGQPLPGLELSSESFEIKAGRAKSIRLTIEKGKTETSIFGRLQVSIAGQTGDQELTESLPVALLHSPAGLPSVEVSEIKTEETNGITWFELPITNRSDGYVPVHARLQVSSRQGRTFLLADGFGRWIAPGETRVLRFVPAETLTADDYQLNLKVETVPDAVPVMNSKIISLVPAATESVSSLDPGASSASLSER